MILDQTIGVHGAQVECMTLGWMQTWVSGEGEEPAIPNALTARVAHFPRLAGTVRHFPRLEAKASHPQ